MTVVLAAPHLGPPSSSGDRTLAEKASADGAPAVQAWVDLLEARGHDVYLVAPSQAGVRATHHVAARPEAADTVRAIADAMEGVPAPVLLLDAEVAGSPVTLEEVASAPGTVVLGAPLPSAASAASVSTDERVASGAAAVTAPLRVVADVVVGAGSAQHAVGSPTHAARGLLRVDGADAEAVSGALRVMADVAATQRWDGPAWPLVLVAAVRSGVTVRMVSAPGLPWEEPGPPLSEEQERQLRLLAATGAPVGVVDRWGGAAVARWVASIAWNIGVGAHSVTVVGLAAALLAGLLVSTGTAVGAAGAALLMLVSVVLDRADGIVARARRTVGPFGAWLDLTAARGREAALVIGLAVGAATLDEPRWGLASGVLALLALAHLAASASTTARGWGRAPAPVRLALDQVDEPPLPPVPPARGRPVPAWLPFSVSRGDGAVAVVIGLVLLPPEQLLVALALLAGLSALACLVLIGAPRPLAAAQRQLLDLADPGPLARVVGRQDPQLSALRRALATRAAAWVPPATWVVESAAVLGSAWVAEPDALPVSLAWLGVLAFHRLDIAARLRVLGDAPPGWVSTVGLGALGRTVLVLLLAAAGQLALGLAVGAVVLGVLFAAESAGRFAGPQDTAA